MSLHGVKATTIIVDDYEPAGRRIATFTRDSKLLIDKAKIIREVIENIRKDMYSGTGNFTEKPFYNLLITCPLRKNVLLNDFDINSFIGGNTPIYISDFVCSINDNNNLNVLKNRHDDNDKKISLGNLKDYVR